MDEKWIREFVNYGIEKDLIEPADRVFVTNRVLECLGMDSMPENTAGANPLVDAGKNGTKPALQEMLEAMTEYAIAVGLCDDNTVARDLFDTKLMGLLTPFPHEVRTDFLEYYESSPEQATDWFYKFSQDTNYIRRDRIKKDVKWKVDSEYGKIDITINLSKPEKDPKAIAAAKLAPQGGYPKCLLCPENEGYAGRINHPARQNHRVIPLSLDGDSWYFQYSPYVYYPEHCIVFQEEHTPMVIDRKTFARLLDFERLFPHYFVGSNADLPIVGGSILSHEHFQGGRYTFAMENAAIEEEFTFAGFEDVKAGIVHWPMSVIRLDAEDPQRLVELSDKILQAWRSYSDVSCWILAETKGEPHNTVTPIARRRGDLYEMDLVLRNNRTTDEFPLGIFHPHAEYFHIKKENIGLIEVMGLAVLPARLKTELAAVRKEMLRGGNLRKNALTEKHANWAEQILKTYTPDEKTIDAVLEQEVGNVFVKVLECAGVYKQNEAGREGFRRFLASVE